MSPITTRLGFSDRAVSCFHQWSSVGENAEVNVYSYRNPQLLEPLFNAFTSETGIKVNSVFISKGMLERLQSEAENSPADLIFTADIGRLTDIKAAGLTQSVDSASIRANVPGAVSRPAGSLVRPNLARTNYRHSKGGSAARGNCALRRLSRSKMAGSDLHPLWKAPVYDGVDYQRNCP